MDNTTNALRAMTNAFEVIVAPTVDPDDPIAEEQLQSAVRYLQFLETRLDLIYDRERFELGHHLRMAEALMSRSACFPRSAEYVSRSIEAARDVLGRLGANVATMRAQTSTLVASIRLCVHEAATAPPESRDDIERVVLELSEERIQVDRSWYFPLGFEHSPDDVVPLREALYPASRS